MKHVLPFAAVAVLLPLAVPAFADDNSSTSQNFVNKAVIGSQFEIQSSQEALQKSKNAEIREFAQQMINDHRKASDDMKIVLASISPDAGIKAPGTALDQEHQEELQELKSEKISDFDEEYIESQLEAHNDAVELFRNYSEKGENADLKNFAKTTLPTLEKHQEHAKFLDEKF